MLKVNKNRASSETRFYLKDEFLLAQDFVHPGSANRAFTLHGFAAILHGHLLGVFHSLLLFTLHAICYFCHFYPPKFFDPQESKPFLQSQYSI